MTRSKAWMALSFVVVISFSCVIFLAIDKDVKMKVDEDNNVEDVAIKWGLHKLTIQRELNGKVVFDICYQTYSPSGSGLSCKFGDGE